MPYVTVHVDASDVLDELSEDELANALEKKRGEAGDDPHFMLLRCYEYYKLKGGAPQCLKEYFWSVLGKYL